ncbi:tagaturonate reductase [Jeotgalibacillus sp. S-D1]|uniref:tagaturonate reductase n=1 Tax=Jeotgalibacillus sp. S-D1 TaxID=2552189 RepID=UPI001059BBCE|nr:tagaturonate reductase [Jeotgalibacillus sp. S-D1]TDL34267.1 tagaturonate reductase [Jeotgalibacillus sp. S-D1]
MVLLSKSQYPASGESFDHLPEKVLQIGEGNFLRGFIDWMIQQMNKQQLFNGSVVAVQPTPHGRVLPKLNAQDWLYTTVLRGMQEGEIVDQSEIITSIKRGINPYSDWNEILKTAASEDLEVVVSNTTEAGITYLQEDYSESESPLSYPGKLAALLYHRYRAFNGDKDAGLIILPCELIEENGKKLKYIVKRVAEDWKFPQEFINWLDAYNIFCDTLVDRIVTGFPKDSYEEFTSRLGYEDQLITVGEPYHMFAIDGDERVQEKLPFHKAGLNVKWGDIEQYREMKVRLLNGPHTLMSSVGFLAGANTVLDVMEDKLLSEFTEQGFREINPAVMMEQDEKQAFINSVKERFLNPYNKHYLADISMNSIYKFKSRLVPTLKRYVDRNETLPQAIVFSLAALLVFYRPIRRDDKGIIGIRNGEEYATRENDEVVEALATNWSDYDEGKITLAELVFTILQNRAIWDEDLNEINQLNPSVTEYLNEILSNGTKASLQKMLDSAPSKTR